MARLFDINNDKICMRQSRIIISEAMPICVFQYLTPHSRVVTSIRKRLLMAPVNEHFYIKNNSPDRPLLSSNKWSKSEEMFRPPLKDHTICSYP